MKKQSFQRLLASSLVVWMPLVTITSAATDSAPKSFVDVSANDWFAPYVQTAVERGFASGYKDANGVSNGYFGPGNRVTYAEALSMIMNMTNTEIGGEPYNLSAIDTWAAPYVATAEAMDLTVYGKGLNVNTPISRGAVAQTIIEISKPAPPRGYLHFADLPTTHTYYAAVETLAEAGIMKGDAKTNTINPDGYINRAEICKILSLLSGPIRSSSSSIVARDDQSSSATQTSVSSSVSSSSAAVYISSNQRLVKQPINVRSGMGMAYRSLLQVPTGTVVDLMEENGVWAKIRLQNGTEGFALSKYLLLPAGYIPASSASSISSSAPQFSSVSSASMIGDMWVINHPVKVRSDASMTSGSQFELPTGTAVVLVEKVGEWAHITLQDGRSGYVVLKFLSRSK
ncbi:MAG: S-layer homology domain-containing protein [Candidatus Peribacteraceae bacterium]|nr:S-layer homology domain-containing protein [Candidatus Peribacteraceae bacterium]